MGSTLVFLFYQYTTINATHLVCANHTDPQNASLLIARGQHQHRPAVGWGVSGEELGVRGKSLRYGAMLDLMGFVNIPLSGGQLAATAKYSMGSGGGFRFGGFRW